MRRIESAGVSRMLEVVKHLSGVHATILCVRVAELASAILIVAILTSMAVDYAPRRVVSLQPSATVILRDLGKLDLLVACTKYCAEVCPETMDRKIAIVSDSWTAQSRQIADAQPDLVIAAVPYQEKAVAEILKSGARFLGLAPKSLADIYSDIA